MIIIIMRGENIVAHLDGLGGTRACRGTPAAYHWSKVTYAEIMIKKGYGY
jgi:hypothetical protein